MVAKYSAARAITLLLPKLFGGLLFMCLVNFAVVIAVFLVSASFATVLESHLPALLVHEGLEKAVIWSGALLLHCRF
jgi:hypothetical protein